jgi:hypothetical protein
VSAGAVMVAGIVAVSLAWGYVAFDEADAVLKARVLRGKPVQPLRARLAARLVPGGEAGVVLPVRVGVGVLLGGLAYLMGANVVAAGVAAIVGAMAVQTIVRARDAVRQRRMVEQLPAFLSAVLMAYLTEASLPRAVERAAVSTPDPLGTMLRNVVASVRANVGGGRQTVGEVLWDVAARSEVRALQRLAYTLQQAEKGAAGPAVYQALESIERELQEDERLRRGRLLAARQSTLIIQAGGLGVGALYVLLALSGDAAIMRTGFGVLVTAVSALLLGVSMLVANTAARRAQPGKSAMGGRRKA